MGFKVLAVIALLIIALHGYTLQRAAKHEKRAMASHPPEGQIVMVDGHRVHAVVLTPENPSADVVLIHGASGNTRDFTHDLAHQLAQTYRVIVFDRPGLGYTDRINRAGATLPQQAQLLSQAAVQLGAEKPIVLGQSYGGAVALAWAVYQPDRLSSLVLLAAASQTWETGLSTYYTLLSHPWIGPLVIPYLTAYVHDERVTHELNAIFSPQQPPAGYDEHIGAGLTLRRNSLRANALQRANLKEEIRDMIPEYNRIIVPTEILHGDADMTVGLHIHSGPLSGQIHQAQLTVLPGIGHMPQHSSKPQVIAAVHRAAARAGLN
ncbi:MAG: alpha/beta fold hydrolase [Thalassovita sp.]